MRLWYQFYVSRLKNSSTGQKTSKEIEEEEVILTVFCETTAAPEVEAQLIEEETPIEEQSIVEALQIVRCIITRKISVWPAIRRYTMIVEE